MKGYIGTRGFRQLAAPDWGLHNKIIACRGSCGYPSYLRIPPVADLGLKGLDWTRNNNMGYFWEFCCLLSCIRAGDVQDLTKKRHVVTYFFLHMRLRTGVAVAA